MPFADLERDVEGEPVEGHLTIASFGWWTRRFADAGMTRRPDVEARIYADIEPAGLTPWWNLYVFAAPRGTEAIAVAREPERDLVSLGLHHPLYGELSPVAWLAVWPGYRISCGVPQITYSEFEHLSFERPRAGVLLVTLDRPGGPERRGRADAQRDVRGLGADRRGRRRVGVRRHGRRHGPSAPAAISR